MLICMSHMALNVPLGTFQVVSGCTRGFPVAGPRFWNCCLVGLVSWIRMDLIMAFGAQTIVALFVSTEVHLKAFRVQSTFDETFTLSRYCNE